jgi:hypothetical protein
MPFPKDWSTIFIILAVNSTGIGSDAVGAVGVRSWSYLTAGFGSIVAMSNTLSVVLCDQSSTCTDFLRAAVCCSSGCKSLPVQLML